ncbi:MAG: flagellar basal body P-ring formation chaperone FlgA [Parvularculaceae bacterium]|nr:flagellar basal body P-ring formation chaperone FlgA [Parvularculaceae bacterium]
MTVLALIALIQGAATLAPPALTRSYAAGALLAAEDLSGDPSSIEKIAGKQLRRFMPAGAVIRAADVREPVLVSRNTLVRMQYVKGALLISAEGRALSNGALGEEVRVLALQSRSTITGVVVNEGLVQVK